jgi:hypothetical protein
LLCTLFTGSLPRKNIEDNFSSRLLAPVKLPVKLGPRCHQLSRFALVAFRTHARCGYSIALRHEVGSILDRNNNTDAGVDASTVRFGFLQRIAPFAPKPEPVAAFRSAIAISRYDRPEHKSSTASSGCDLPADFEFVHARAVDDVVLQPLPQFLSLIQPGALRCGVGVMTFEEKLPPYNPVLVHGKPTAVLD